MSEKTLSEAERAKLIYENAGREITQQFDTMASCLTLASGTVAALLALLGGSEIFAAHIGTNGQSVPPDLEHIPKLSSVALVVLSLAFPFLVRFFTRSMIAYQNLLRFQKIQGAAWQFLDEKAAYSKCSNTVLVYETRWRTPKPLRSLIWQNLKYNNFFWVFLVAGTSIVWAFITSTGATVRVVALLILLVGMTWEVGTLIVSRGRYFTAPTAEDEELLEPPSTSEEVFPDRGEADIEGDARAIRGQGRTLEEWTEMFQQAVDEMDIWKW